MVKDLGCLIDDFRILALDLQDKQTSLAASYRNAPSLKAYNLTFYECSMSLKRVSDDATALLKCVSNTLQELEGKLLNLERDSESLMHTINLNHEAGNRRYVGRRILIKNTAYFENIETVDNCSVYKRDIVLKSNKGVITMVPLNLAKGITSEKSELKISRPKNMKNFLQSSLYEHGHFSKTPANPWLSKKARLLTDNISQNVLTGTLTKINANSTETLHRSKESNPSLSSASGAIQSKTQINESSVSLETSSVQNIPLTPPPAPPVVNLSPLSPAVPSPATLPSQTSLKVNVAKSNPPPPAPARNVKFLYQAIVVYDYEKSQEDELTIHKEATVNVLRVLDDGWMEVQYNGEKGLVPGNYVERI